MLKFTPAATSIGALIIGCLMGATPASAQNEAPADTAAPAADAGQIEDIVVTARKRSENLQTVPVAVSALGEAQLERTFATQLNDITSVPNVVLDEAPGFRNVASFYIRGLGYQDIDLTFEPAVGVVVDGIFLSKANGALLDVFDLKSLEILRGPQGTLFGRNTMGGVINVTTKRPSGDFGLEGVARFGNAGRQDYRAAVEAPLGEAAAIRLSFLKNNLDGYARNAADNNERLGGTDTLMVRGVLTAKLTDTLDAVVTADLMRDRSEASPVNNTSVNLGEPMPLQNALPLLGFPADTDGDLLRVRSNRTGPFDVDSKGVSLELNWKLGGVNVTSITGYRDQDENTYSDIDGEAVTLFELPRVADFNQFFQELRMDADIGDNLDLVAGLNYMRVKHFQNLGFTLDCNLLGFPGCPAPGTVASTLETPQRQTVDSYGVFAQGSYKITPEFRITGGIRWSRDEKTFDFTETRFADNNLGLQGLSLGSLLAGAPAAATVGEFQAKFNKFTWRIGADYQFSRDIFGYASVATGFKSGGFNGRASTFAQVGPYDPETVTAYEVGLKTELFDRKLRLNTALFWNEYADLQIEVLQQVGGANVTLVTNAAKARIRGVEVEATARLAQGLTLDANIGYLDAQYKNFIADLFSRGFVTNNDNLKLRRAPKWTMSAGLNYQHDFGDGSLTWTGDWSYRSDYETNVQNYDFGTHKSEHLFNASVKFQTGDERFALTLYGRNLTNEVRVSSSNPIPPFSSFNQPTDPRTYGVEVRFKY